VGPFFAKIIQLYPFSQSLIVQSLLNSLPHKSMATEQQFQWYKLAYDFALDCPDFEERILSCVVERLCQIDVDIKVKIRKFCFSDLYKIQPLSTYVKGLCLKIPTEKEMRVGILFDQLLDFIARRLESPEQGGEFVDVLIRVFESKIFPIHKLNFMQHLPLAIIAVSRSNPKASMFTEKLITLLIFKAFNCNQREHLTVRQQSWNFLASLLARQNSILKDSLLIKTLKFSMRFFDASLVKAKKPRQSRENSECSSDVSEPINYASGS
jgi:hypothetical protein